MNKPLYADLGSLSEDERIDVIGLAVRDGKTLAFIVDSEKAAARYIQKLLSKWPGVAVIAQFEGPVTNTVAVKVGPRPITNVKP